MYLWESLRIAWSALLSNKLRALLTMLGIIIGIGAVIGMLAIGSGYGAWVRSEFNKQGVGIIYITPRVDDAEASNDQRPQLTAADAEALLQPGAVPALTTVVIEYQIDGAVVSAGHERYFYPIKGITPNHFSITDHTLGAGRYYNQDDETNRARVAVIGKNVASALFGATANALNQRIAINGVFFEVVGILSTEPSVVSNDNPAELVYVPYATARSRLFRNEATTRVDVSQITAKAHDSASIDPAIKQITELLRQRHRLTYQSNDFSITNPQQQAAEFESILAGFNAFLGSIAGISLLVGGIGIMNIMLVSVTQRTREIGLRKAVGARPRDILLQFLIEAIVLCLIGGAIGIGLGYLLSSAGTFVLVGLLQLQGAQAIITSGSILLATIVSGSIGIFFGFFPARRAARLNPITALRHE